MSGCSMEKLYIRGTVYPFKDYLSDKTTFDLPIQQRWNNWFGQIFAQATPIVTVLALAGLGAASVWWIRLTVVNLEKLQWFQDYWPALLLVSLLLVAIAGGLAVRYLRSLSVFFYTAMISSRPLPFEADQWQAATYSNHSNSPNDTARVRMVDDLLRQYDFIGLPSVAVFALLGQPTEMPLFSDWDILYFLGPEPGLFSTSHLWLGFQLDDQQRVTNCQVIAD